LQKLSISGCLAKYHENKKGVYIKEFRLLRDRISELENDIMVLVLRLMGEDESTFAPETREVMLKWKDRALAELDNV
jgi:hypothetical protein